MAPSFLFLIPVEPKWLFWLLDDLLFEDSIDLRNGINKIRLWLLRWDDDPGVATLNWSLDVVPGRRFFFSVAETSKFGFLLCNFKRGEH